jgi:hypothetical protein
MADYSEQGEVNGNAWIDPFANADQFTWQLTRVGAAHRRGLREALLTTDQKRLRYSVEEIKALTISALLKSPSNSLSFASQN